MVFDNSWLISQIQQLLSKTIYVQTLLYKIIFKSILNTSTSTLMSKYLNTVENTVLQKYLKY